MQPAPQRPPMQARAACSSRRSRSITSQHLDDDQLEIPAFLRRQAN